MGRHTWTIANRRCNNASASSGKKIPHPLRRGPFRIVVVHPGHDLADFARFTIGIVGRPQSVIENHDTGGAALRFHQRFHFWVINSPHFAIVEEVGDFGVVAHETKALAIEHEFVGVRTAVVDHDTPRISGAAALVGRPSTARLGENLHPIVNEIIEGRFDLRNRFGGRLPFQDLIHCQLLRRNLATGGDIHS